MAKLIILTIGLAFIAVVSAIGGVKDIAGNYYDLTTGQISSSLTGKVYNTAHAVVAAPYAAAPLVAAPYAAASYASAPLVAAPYASYAAPYASYAASYAAPYAAPYAAYGYGAPLAYGLYKK